MFIERIMKSILLRRWGLLVSLLFVSSWLQAWDGALSPHDSAHLVILWPEGFRTGAGTPVATVADNGAQDKIALPLQSNSIEQPLTIRYAGSYALWLHLAGAAPVVVELVRDGKTVASAVVNEGRGSASVGGPEGSRLFVAGIAAVSKEAADAVRGKGYDVAGGLSLSDDVKEDGLDDILEGMTETTMQAGRLETCRDRFRPFFWWKAFSSELQPGIYTLRVRRQLPDATPGLSMDLAFLSTASDKVLSYPSSDDFVRPHKGTYLRFRLDEVPSGGMTIEGGASIHGPPWGAGPWRFNPGGLGTEKEGLIKHMKAGYTRWYRLQDGGGPASPPYGGSPFSLNLNLAPSDKVRGATQFASYPHPDCVMREIAWNAPSGLRFSLQANYDAYPETIRTFQDHARIHYEWALTGAENRIFPLAPTDFLLFGNSAGSVTDPSAQDYAYKTVRLFGVNVAAVADPLVYRRLYGGGTAGGQYWPEVRLPYNEAATRLLYEKDYEKTFKSEDSKEWVIYQNADEPGEIGREKMSAPLWRYLKATPSQSERWMDECGGSALYAKNKTLPDSVLEGEVLPVGRTLEFRARVADSATDSGYAFWSIGQGNSESPNNLTYGIAGGAVTTLRRAFCKISDQPVRFKIVMEKDQSTLFVDGQPAGTVKGLPSKGMAGLAGPRKAVLSLCQRALSKDEHITALTDKSDIGGASGNLPENDMALDEPAQDKLALGGKPLKSFVEEDCIFGGGIPAAHQGFRTWAAAKGLKPELFGKKTWDDVTMLTLQASALTPEEKRLYYWSRRYSGYLTPKMFALASDGMRKHASNPSMRSFVALSGHALYMGGSEMPLDMFELARQGLENGMMAGVSDVMALAGPGSWRWDSEHSVAYSVAPYNAGVREYGKSPRNFPMMHCDWPRDVRSHTQLANQVKFLSYFWWGPEYIATEYYWSEGEGSYGTVCRTDNRASQVADLLGPAVMRPSRVALLYAHSTEYWSGADSYADKRALFLALAHEYYQPELVTEQQIRDGALAHYDALYVVEPHVEKAVQDKISEWVLAGGRLWACANALRFDEYDQPADLLANLAGLKRGFASETARTATAASDDESRAGKAGEVKMPVAPKAGAGLGEQVLTVSPVKGQSDFRPHRVFPVPPRTIECDQARVRATYDDGRTAWLEKAVGKGLVSYLGHRGGLTYSRNALVVLGFQDLWMDATRVPLTAMLHESKIPRELVLSEACVMAQPLSTDQGTVIPVANLRAYAIDRLEFMLREPVKPYSVQVFDGVQLVDLPFEYSEGCVRMVLPRLDFDASTMLVVRRAAAPKDDRCETLRKQAEANLADNGDWRARSAGAWFAGFYPEWKQADKLLSLLKDAQPEVRRSAAESLGRLRYAPAKTALQEAIKTEKDPHALAEYLLALARIAPDDAVPLCVEMAVHPEVMVRRQAVMALATMVRDAKGKAEAALASAARKVATGAMLDSDARVFVPALDIWSNLEPKKALEIARQSLAGEGPGAARSSDWVNTIARSSAVLDEYVKQDCSGDVRLLEAIAARHQHPALEKALLARYVELKDSAWAAVLNMQSPDTARALFEVRDKLAPALRPAVLALNERVFRVHLGSDAASWNPRQ